MKEKIGVNIKNVIGLLAKNVYTTQNVVIRELVQNAHDSIVRRFGADLVTQGRIHLTCNSTSLQITDNGTGMDDEELRKYLATLAQGIRQAEEGIARKKKQTTEKTYQEIGEFGIGFFSAFMIADQISVTTRKDGAQRAYRWLSEGLEEYDITEVDGYEQIGTSVTLQLQRGSRKYANNSVLQEIVERYCAYLPCAIFIGKANESINRGSFPWEITDADQQHSALEVLIKAKPTFLTTGQSSPTSIPFHYAFAIRNSVRKHHEIYSRRMFVSADHALLPDHLSFLDVVINCDSLPLDISREHVTDEYVLVRIIEELEQQALDWLKLLAKAEARNSAFTSIIALHQELFRQLVAENRDLFDKLYPHLVFSRAGEAGEVAIDHYLSLRKDKKHPVIYVTELRPAGGLDSDRLLLLICKKRNIPVIAVKTSEDDDLLRRICVKRGLDRIPLSEYASELTAPSQGEQKPLEIVRRNFEHFFNHRTRLADIADTSLPFVVSGDEILLNERNQFLKQLGTIPISSDRVRPLYFALHKALRALNHSALSQASMEELIKLTVDTLTDWAQNIIEWETVERDYTALTDRWWREPQAITEIIQRPHPFQRDGLTYRYKCFVIRPFSPRYQDVLNITQQVCKQYGIYAESAEEIENGEILAKVCRYIDQADFAIADISENNPNVMLELGLAMARRKPAIVIRDKEAAENRQIRVPADIIGIERIEYNNITADLRDKLTSVCKRLVEQANAQGS